MHLNANILHSIYLYAFGWSFGHSVAPYLTA